MRLINKYEEARQREAESLRFWARGILLQSIELRVRDALTSGRYKVTGIGQDGRRVEIDRLDVAAMMPRFHEGVNALASPTRRFDDVVVEDATVLLGPIAREAQGLGFTYKRGPKGDLTGRAATTMLEDFRSGRETPTSLQSMKQESLAEKYGVKSRETAKKALQKAQSEFVNSNSGN